MIAGGVAAPYLEEDIAGLESLDHGHDHSADAVPHTHLTSVGIDIGSSTSHLMFSRLTVGYPTAHRRRPEVLTREVLSRSRVMLTPFAADRRIDADPLRELIFGAFVDAGLAPDQIDTGAVIVTGEAARRDNARAITELFSDEAGRFVCATAGPRLEGLMAAHGSGAVALSRERGVTTLHIDIGGGTTKISRIEAGRVVETTAVNIGARLVAYDSAGRLTRKERAGDQLLRTLGHDLELGDPIPKAIRTALAKAMAAVLFSALEGQPPVWDDFWVLAPLEKTAPIDHVVFSGGVAEYIYGRESASFGDLGPDLGAAVRAEADRRGYLVIETPNGIRATVIGASAYTMQLSGETIFIPHPEQLPVRHLRTCVAAVTWEPPIAERAERAIRDALQRRDPEELGAPFALVLTSPPFYGYGAALELADGLRRALSGIGSDQRPRLLVFEQNIGQVVGSTLSSELQLPCIDEISLSELDFVDVGRPVAQESYVPVVVKSLAFGV